MSILSRAKKMLRKEEKAAEKKPAGKQDAGNTEAVATADKSSVPVISRLESTLTEKGLRSQEKNVVVFRVHPKASKGQIASAIESQYGVTPISIRTLRVRPKMRRRGITTGYTKHWKKAYVKVKDVSKFNE